MNNYKLKRLFKKVLFFLILTTLLWICKLSFVNAAEYENIRLWDGATAYSWSTGNAGYYLNSNAFRAITFSTDIVGDLAGIKDYKYGFISYCSYDNVYQTYSGTNVTELQQFDTFVKSTIYGSNIPCTIKYFTFKFVYDCGADGRSCVSSPTIRFYGDASDYTLRSYGFTKEPLQIDTSTGQVINQNATIISQNQTIINKTDETNKKLDDLNKNLTDESSPNLNGLENSAGWLKPGPVDSIINLPLTLLNNLQTNLGNTCNPVTLKLPYVKKDINLPCISAIYKQINGLDTWFQGIGVIAAAFILYRYFMYLYNRIDDTLSFRENNMQGYFDDSLWGGM